MQAHGALHGRRCVWRSFCPIMALYALGGYFYRVCGICMQGRGKQEKAEQKVPFHVVVWTIWIPALVEFPLHC